MRRSRARAVLGGLFITAPIATWLLIANACDCSRQTGEERTRNELHARLDSVVVPLEWHYLEDVEYVQHSQTFMGDDTLVLTRVYKTSRPRETVFEDLKDVLDERDVPYEVADPWNDDGDKQVRLQGSLRVSYVITPGEIEIGTEADF